MYKIAVLTQGESVPSTRFRVLQYNDLFNESSISVSVFHAYSSAYPPKGVLKRLVWLTKELFARFIHIIKINISDVDLVILQRELVSTLPTLELFISKKVVFDVDDAIFLYKKGIAARLISKKAIAVVCGNSYLADYFSNYNNNVFKICTPVDTNRFEPSVQTKTQKYLGWSGSSSGFSYLYEIEAELEKTLNANPEWRLLIVADRPPEFKILDEDNFLFEKWSPTTEVTSIQKMAIGLMPLSDNEWSKGKCSYKMLLYMACGIPSIVSYVGMNKEILELGAVGFGVVDDKNWTSCLNKLMSDAALRQQMGSNARTIAETYFSLTVAADKWIKIIREVSEA